jgi:hypothetical protein
MKQFLEIDFDPNTCRAELDELRELLSSKPELSERGDLQPFFKAHRQLTAFLGTLAPDVGPADLLAFEYPIFGDFVADIVIGNKHQGAYCLIELEDGRTDSIFSAGKGRATRPWGRRFEQGFSQLVDWFWLLDDVRNTQPFARDYGPGHVSFFGLLLIGRSDTLNEADRRRLKWRQDRVLVNSNKVNCLTFDHLYAVLSEKLRHYLQSARD